MTLKFSTPVRNAMLDAIETIIAGGGAPVLKLRTGAPPGSCAASDTGSVLATMTLPLSFMADAANGSKVISGTWEDLAADAAGSAGHFRIYANDGSTCHAQGTVGLTGSGADMELDNTSIGVGQRVTVTTFTLANQDG